MKNTKDSAVIVGSGAKVTRDGNILTVKVGGLTISIAATMPAEKLIARRAIAQADRSVREKDDETGPGGFRRSSASQKIEAALTALIAEIREPIKQNKF